jgi:hypothetical protein
MLMMISNIVMLLMFVKQNSTRIGDRAALRVFTTRKDRFTAWDEAVQKALDWQKAVQRVVRAGRTSGIAELMTQAYVLGTQIARETAGTDE